jgi:hypothetical protein
MSNYDADILRFHGTTVVATLSTLRNKQWGYADTPDEFVGKDAAGNGHRWHGGKLFHDVSATGVDASGLVALRAQARGEVRVEYDTTEYLKIDVDSSGNATLTPTGTVLTVAGRTHISDSTEATTTTDVSVHTDGGLSGGKSAVIGDDLELLSDGAILSFGADKDVNLTHVADTGLHLNGALGLGVTPSVKLDIHNGSSGYPTIYLRADGVIHGRTTIQPTDVFGSLGTANGGSGYAYGGLGITGISDDAGTSGLYLRGIIGVTDPTDSQPAIHFAAGKANGGTAWAALGDDETVLEVDNYSTTVFRVMGDGDSYIAGDLNIGAGKGYQVNGTQVVGAQGATVSDPSGGAVVDSEARDAISDIIDRLQAHGLIA